MNYPEPSITTNSPPDALAVANRLRPVVIRIYRRLRHELRDLNITNAQVSLLAAIRHAPGIGLTELAARQDITTAAMSTLVDRLEDAGFIERLRSESGDRRRVGVRLTPAGEDLLDTVRSRRTAWLATHLAALSPDDLAAIDAAVDPLVRLIEAEP